MTQWTRRRWPEVLVFLVSLTVYPSTSHAYLDPGTGSYAFQMLLAVGLVLFFTARVYWKKARTQPSSEGTGDAAAAASDASKTTKAHKERHDG